jgi:hypothetical protein
MPEPDYITEGGKRSTHNTVFLLVASDVTLTRQLSCLPDRYKSGSQSSGNDRSQKEPTGIQTDDDIDLLVSGRWKSLGEDVAEEVGHQGFRCERVSEDGLQVSSDMSGYENGHRRSMTYEDIQEGDSLRSDRRSISTQILAISRPGRTTLTSLGNPG